MPFSFASLSVATLLAAGPGLQSQGSPFLRPAGWEAFFKDPETGVLKNLPEALDQIDSRTWLGLQWTDYRGARLRVSVMPVDNKVAGAVPMSAVEDLLGSSLFATHRFRLYERKALDSILMEKLLQTTSAASQPATPAEAPKPIGEALSPPDAARPDDGGRFLQQMAAAAQAAKLVGAQYLVFASVTEWTPSLKKKPGGGSMFGGLARAEDMAEVAMSFRVVDALTGEVKEQVDERAAAGNLGFSLFGIEFGGTKGGTTNPLQEKSPINYAVRACVNKVAFRIAKALKNQPWRGAVVKVAEGGKVYVNAGKDLGMEVGMVLDAQSLGEALRDPYTGEILDTEIRSIGKITLQEVRDRISVGTLSPVESGLTLKPGDRVEMSTPQ